MRKKYNFEKNGNFENRRKNYESKIRIEKGFLRLKLKF